MATAHHGTGAFFGKPEWAAGGNCSWMDKVQLDWPEAALPRCASQRSFHRCGGLPRGSALLGDRRPFLQRCLAAVHTRAKGFRAGRRNLTFVAVPQEKKGTHLVDHRQH